MNHHTLNTKTRRHEESPINVYKSEWTGSRSQRAVIFQSIVVFLVGLAASCQGLYGESLDVVVETVSRLHPVVNVDVGDLSDSLSQGGSGGVVLFDVREEKEFKVSHLKDAIRVNPGVKADDFLKRHAETLKNKTGVFYCSVGYRSSILVERLLEQTGDSTRLVNLRGGIFSWYNEGNAVYDSVGVADTVHPYSNFWGRLLKERSKVDSARANP